MMAVPFERARDKRDVAVVMAGVVVPYSRARGNL